MDMASTRETRKYLVTAIMCEWDNRHILLNRQPGCPVLATDKPRFLDRVPSGNIARIKPFIQALSWHG